MSRSAKSKAALDPVAEAAALGKRLAEGAKLFQEVRDEDVQIATSEKVVIWQQDKVTLYRYRSLAEQKVRTPVLIVYGLIGRHTIADLQEDRSLVRNLLKLGVDLYVVDWGNPSRADRFVTLDDYIDGYLAECVNVISEAGGGGGRRSIYSGFARVGPSRLATRRCTPRTSTRWC
ncbi:hypothetical protein QA634_35340 (plasmid) [Methylobacterium sp. CB376]|uniref:hypothetical protein n=1 Tax=Methylobacterium sp. CB376 TaxID=3138063 RepID=UPI0024B150B6|nr:hypothetical protein [Methylobacterium nodulans]WFT83808.1 hypothetical protein QA634_35340 [Methylobacterium nodulans]